LPLSVSERCCSIPGISATATETETIMSDDLPDYLRPLAQDAVDAANAQVDHIRYLAMFTLASEAKSFAVTRTPHDARRLLKLVRHLHAMTGKLVSDLEALIKES
jgi:hypothetical protein